MKTRVLVAAFALLLTFGLVFAAHAQGYPLLDDDAVTPTDPGAVRVSARP